MKGVPPLSTSTACPCRDPMNLAKSMGRRDWGDETRRDSKIGVQTTRLPIVLQVAVSAVGLTTGIPVGEQDVKTTARNEIHPR